MPMKIQFASDIHLEFFSNTKNPPSRPGDVLAETDADVIVLAGDIAKGQKAVQWADEVAQTFGKPVILVAGNHEFYGGVINRLHEKMRSAAASIEGVYYLERDEIIIGNTRFLGTTLWTDYQGLGTDHLMRAMEEAERVMNDHRKIRILDRGAYRKFKPHDAQRQYLRSTIWLKERLAEPFDGRTVVITHHGPSPKCQPQEYALSILSPAYWSDQDALIQDSDIDLWICGHSHACLDTEVGHTRIVSNARGYPNFWQGHVTSYEVASYRPDWVVTVGRER